MNESIQLGGAYAIAETVFTPWLTTEVGVREQLHSQYSPKLLPQIALLVTPWQPEEGRFLRLRASWGMGYRTPSLRDLYQPPVAQLGGFYFLAGNPDLIPENLQTARIGFEWLPLANLSISATAFRNDIDDHIRSTLVGNIQTGEILVPPPPLTPSQEDLCRITNNALAFCIRTPTVLPITSSLFQKTNLDSVITQGAEARVRVRPHPLVAFEAAYTYLDTNVTDSNSTLTELPNEPRHVVDVGMTVQAPRTGTRLTALGRWRGKALTETSGTGLLSFGTLDTSDPSFVLDLRLIQPLKYGFELYGDIFNVTDERVVDSYVVRGRTFFIGVRGSFN